MNKQQRDDINRTLLKVDDLINLYQKCIDNEIYEGLSQIKDLLRSLILSLPVENTITDEELPF